MALVVSRAGVFLSISISFVAAFCLTAQEIKHSSDSTGTSDQKNPWAGSQEGDFVKYRSVAKSIFKDDVQTTESEMTQTIKKVTPDEITLEFTTRIKTLDSPMTYESKIPLKPAAEPPKRVNKGTDEIRVEGRTFSCTIWESTIDYGGLNTTMLRWECAEAPGGWVKTEMKTGEGKNGTRTVMTLVKLSDKFKVRNQELTCHLFESSVESVDGSVEGMVWMCPDVPGGIVKSTHKTKLKTMTTESTIELIDFKATRKSAPSKELSQKEAEELYDSASKLFEQKKYDGAIEAYQKVSRAFPTERFGINAAYNAACGHALLSQKENAMDWLERAVANGFHELDHLQQDPDLASLRDEPRYKKLIDKMKQDAPEEE